MTTNLNVQNIYAGHLYDLNDKGPVTEEMTKKVDEAFTRVSTKMLANNVDITTPIEVFINFHDDIQTMIRINTSIIDSTIYEEKDGSIKYEINVGLTPRPIGV